MIGFTAFAQRIVKGQVISDKEEEPLIGVAIVEKGTSNGTITDIDGNFSLKVGNNATLVISYVGYTTQQVQPNGQTDIMIRLVEDNKVLDDVVVIGYGTQRKSDLTGAVASVKAEDLKNRSTTDAAAALQGKAAGVQILNTSGKPGQGAEIRVRGYSSNSGNISPLLIVDGLQVSSIQYLDPELIESMEVLKDAASAAIYGAEAGNGVVLITTKNGAKNKGKGTVTYNVKFTNNSLGRVPQLLNATQFTDWMSMNLGEERVKNDFETAKAQYNWNPNTNTDWLKEYFENTWSTQHSLSFQGGNDRGSYFMNVNYTTQDGIVKGDKDYYNRLTAQINADYKIKDWLKVGINNSIEKYSMSSVSEQNYGTAFEMLLLIDPLTPLYWTSPDQMLPEYRAKLEAVQNGTADAPYEFYGDKNGYYATSYFNQRLAGGNPFSQRDRAYAKSNGVNINGTAFANITPVKWLTFTSRLGYRLNFANSSDYGTPYYLNSQTSNKTYSISSNTSNGTYYMWENFLNANYDFGKHNVSGMAGMSYRQSDSNYVNASASGPDILNAYSPNFLYLNSVNGNADTAKSIKGQPGKTTSISYFGRLSYAYDNRYSLQFNVRADAFDSSKLAKDNRWGVFFSGSAGWTFSNESFIKDNVSPEVMSFGKIRASYGTNGNVNVLHDYAYTAGIATNAQTYQYGTDNTPTYGSMPNGLANPKLTWETSNQLDLGLDLRFLSDRLSLGIDWYKKVTKDLLVPAPCLPETGVATQTINAGEIENSGLEVEFSWKDNIGDFQYGISGNIATLKNKATYLDPSITRLGGNTVSGSNLVTSCQFEEGYPVWYMRGYQYKGRAADGSAIYYDKDGNETGNPTDADMGNIGSGIPDVTMGITLNAAWKGIDLSVFGAGSFGSDIYYGMYRAGYNNISKDIYDIAKAGKKFPDMQKVAGDQHFWSSSAMVFDGSFFKIKQIQLGYTLPKSITQKVFMQNVRAYVSFDDFFTFTDYPGLDPETCSVGSNGIGLDAGAYPNMAKIVLGASITF